MRWPGRFVWPAAAVFVVAAELLALPGTTGGAAAADLAAGASILFAGLIGWRLRSESLIGPLFVAAGIAWFAGTLATAGVGFLAAIGTAAVTLHRAPLVHAVLSYPSGRLSGRLERAVVVAAYVYAALALLREDRVATAALVVLMLGTAGYRYSVSGVGERRLRRMSVVGAATLSLALSFVVVPRYVAAFGLDSPMTLRAYELLLAALAVGLVAALVRGHSTQFAVADLVVELGGGFDAGTLRGRLARALGDPSLEVGYWLDESSVYVDERGHTLALPAPGSRRRVTAIERDGLPLAVIAHEDSVLADAVFVEGVAAAVRMAVSNVRLRAAIRKQLEEISLSRRRIVAAGDAQRRRLAQEFRHGPERQLAEVERRLRQARAEASSSDPDRLTCALEEAQAELASAGEELRRFANGIHPAALTEKGLAAALAPLVRRATVPVELECPADRLPESVEAAAYFVCSEGLANLGKFAQASRASLSVSCADGRVVVSVRDDGVGGADPNAGSGLRGLADRVESLGGTLRIESAAGRGTLLVAELPLAR